MTTKRSIETELDDLSERILSDLDATERIRLIYQAQAAGDEDRVSRLVDSTPKVTYETVHHSYKNRMLFVQAEVQTALYDLQTTWQKLLWLDSRLHHLRMMDLFDLYPTDVADDLPDTAFPGAEEQIGRLENERTLAVFKLYLCYHVSRRFARDELGLTLEEFLTPMPRGFALELIEEAVEFNQSEIEELTEQARADEDDVPTPADLVEREYRSLAAEWKNAEDPKKWKG